MGVLTEYLRTEADQLRKDDEQRRGVVAEWQAALAALFPQLRQWLGESDPHGLLSLTPAEVVVREGRLGAYPAPSLTVTLGNRTASVVPRGRYSVGAVTADGVERRTTGLVEILDRDETPAYYLYRVTTDAGDRWYAQPAYGRYPDPDRGGVVALGRESFEAAVLSALQ